MAIIARQCGKAKTAREEFLLYGYWLFDTITTMSEKPSTYPSGSGNDRQTPPLDTRVEIRS